LKFSYQWIRELVPGLSIDINELYSLITTKTAECERIESFGSWFANVVAARILAVEVLPKGKNKSVLAEVGPGKQIRVVCGAPNVRPGLLAPWVPPGTVLEGQTIGRAVIEGVESEGMLASAAELGINRDHSGLLELDGAEPGALLRNLQPDWIFEIDNKSLTHRPDLWGHYGMAREVAAISKGTLQDPVNPALLPRGDAPLKIEIADHVLCPRYSALAYYDVRITVSPWWLQARLESIGLNSINNLVDVTNYVLAELPQPMHAFDADKLHGDTIFIRPARAGERLDALNGETYELTEADLVIADAKGPVALAGVIGGAQSAVSESTTRVVFESANFDATSVRLTSSRHKIRTDASMRFEKSLDPENTLRGLARAVALLREFAPDAHPIGGVADSYTPKPGLEPIALPTSFVVRKLGKRLTEDEIAEILRALGFGVSIAPGLVTVTVPSWRATKDIRLKDDLVEEIGRMVGYSEIVPSAPLVASVVPPSSAMRIYLRQVRHILASQGFSEVYNYSFVTVADAERFGMKPEDHIAVCKPIASELSHLRRSLLPGLFKNIQSNVRNFSEFRLFEVGNEIHPSGLQMPYEVPHLAAAFYDANGDEQNFFELKCVLECAFPKTCLTAASETRSYEHPSRTAIINWGAAEIGRIFELHPTLLAADGIEGRAVFFHVDLRQCLDLASQTQIQYRPLRKYPTSAFDLSVVAGARTPVGDLEQQLRRLAGDRLVTIEFVRQYSGPPLPEGQKSVSYRLEIGAADRTLTGDEAGAVRERIVKGMQSLGFEIRGLDG
jgi:phenylalanyl-tRNA synthetase beta chain